VTNEKKFDLKTIEGESDNRDKLQKSAEEFLYSVLKKNNPDFE
jgi:hypothetical protein